MIENTNNKTNTSIVKSVVGENILRMEKIHLTEIIDIIRPLYTFAPEELIEKELKSKARYIMRSFKDEDGVRTFFSDNSGVYVNIEQSKDIDDLSKVSRQLSVKYSGILTAMDKVKLRIKEIMPKFLLKHK
jgi:hypothetical protein